MNAITLLQALAVLSTGLPSVAFGAPVSGNASLAEPLDSAVPVDVQSQFDRRGGTAVLGDIAFELLGMALGESIGGILNKRGDPNILSEQSLASIGKVVSQAVQDEILRTHQNLAKGLFTDVSLYAAAGDGNLDLLSTDVSTVRALSTRTLDLINELSDPIYSVVTAPNIQLLIAIRLALLKELYRLSTVLDAFQGEGHDAGSSNTAGPFETVLYGKGSEAVTYLEILKEYWKPVMLNYMTSIYRVRHVSDYHYCGLYCGILQTSTTWIGGHTLHATGHGGRSRLSALHLQPTTTKTNRSMATCKYTRMTGLRVATNETSRFLHATTSTSRGYLHGSVAFYRAIQDQTSFV